MTATHDDRDAGGGAELFRSRSQLDTVLRRIGDGVTVQDRAGRLVYANDAAAQLIGFASSAELLSTPVEDVLGRFEVLDEQRRPLPPDRLPGRLALQGLDPEPATVCYRLRSTGEERWSVVRATGILGENGRPTHAINVFHDVTAVKREEERARFMAEVTTVLNRSLDLRETLSELGGMVVPAFADLCLLDVVGANGELEERVCTHADPARERVLRELRRRFGRERGDGHPAVVAVRERRPVLITETTEDDLRAASAGPEQLELYHALRPLSYVAVPLLVRDRLHGVLSLGTDVSARRFGESDVLFARGLANRVAAAVENARLYAASRDSEKRLAFLAEAGEILASSLDHERTLATVVQLAVPELADWCVVDVVGEDGDIERLAIAHAGTDKAVLGEELALRHPPDPKGSTGPARVIRSGRSELVPEITQAHLDAAAAGRPGLRSLLRELGPLSAMIVPLRGRERTVGAITFVSSSESGRHFGDEDLRVAEELARRATAAIENAMLFREAERRADAARALQFIGEGVFLVDEEGVVRVWNPAAEAITGRTSADVVGRRAEDVLPEWPAVLAATAEAGRPATLPLARSGEERWLAVARAAFPGGAVFTFQDVTEDRRLERLKEEFVATVSHQLRTPVAAVYGAAMTLSRRDVELAPATREELLGLVRYGADRLARIVDDILAAGQLDAGRMSFALEPCEPGPLLEQAVEAARVLAPAGIELRASVAADTPAVGVDPEKLEQVLANLLENAIKYSPDGGRVQLRAAPAGACVLFTVEDDGLGIPPGERERVFERFYRLDPNLVRGVGGTGLGLYVCRELVERMGGRIWIEGRAGRGTAVSFELPVAAARPEAPQRTSRA